LRAIGSPAGDFGDDALRHKFWWNHNPSDHLDASRKYAFRTLHHDRASGSEQHDQ
jgi:hypothetical protein